LSADVLAETDVLTWWGHAAHDQVADSVVDRVQARVLDGMGLVVLHSGHKSKIFMRLMGTTCNLRWRSDEGGEREVIWTVSPSHPIAAGVPQPIVVPHQEMYGEFFDVPPPDELVFISSFAGGEVFRSGCCYHRGAGRVVYFSPGDQEFPVYHQPEIQRVIANCVAWCGARATPNDLASERTGSSQRNWFL
jgi:trehalose utilization protein